MVVPNFNCQIRIMVNKFYTQIGIVIYKFILATIARIMSHYIDVRVMVNDFNPQIGVVVNNLYPAIQWKLLAVRLACDGTGILVYGKLAKVYGLRTCTDGGQHDGKKQGKKQFFHSIQSV